MTAHRMPKNPRARRIGWKLRLHQGTQLLRDIRVHPVVTGPGLDRGVYIEARTDAEVPRVAVARQFQAARAGVRRNEHDPELRSDPLRTRLDHEGLFGASETGEVIQHRNASRLRLRRREHRELHGAGGAGRFVLIKSHCAVEAPVLTDDFEWNDCHDGAPILLTGVAI